MALTTPPEIMQVAGPATERTCPNCGARVPVDPGFVSWCDRCGWNLAPAERPTVRNRLDQVYVALGKRSGRQLFEEVRRTGGTRPSLSAPALAAFLLAGLVHLVSLACIGPALWLVISTWPNLFAIVLTMGLPLLNVLDPCERVALLAHEMAHEVNGDYTRGVFLSWALRTLAGWYVALYPSSIFASEFGRTVHSAVARAALNNTDDLFADIRQRAATIPPREWERLRRASRLEDARLDDSHPPTVFRLDLLRVHPVGEPAIRLSPAEVAAIDAELVRLEQPIVRELKSSYKASLYY